MSESSSTSTISSIPPGSRIGNSIIVSWTKSIVVFVYKYHSRQNKFTCFTSSSIDELERYVLLPPTPFTRHLVSHFDWQPGKSVEITDLEMLALQLKSQEETEGQSENI